MLLKRGYWSARLVSRWVLSIRAARQKPAPRHSTDPGFRPPAPPDPHPGVDRAVASDAPSWPHQPTFAPCPLQVPIPLPPHLHPFPPTLSSRTYHLVALTRENPCARNGGPHTTTTHRPVCSHRDTHTCTRTCRALLAQDRDDLFDGEGAL